MVTQATLVALALGIAVVGLTGALLVMLRHLAAHTHATEALRISEARNQAILRAMPDLVFRLDREGCYLDVRADGPDKEALLVFTEHPHTMIGKRVTDILPHDQAALITAAIQHALDTDTTQIIEYTLPTRSGKRQFEAHLAPGNSEEVVSVVRDVTARKQVEREREELIAELHAFGQTVAHDLKTPLTSVVGYAEVLADDYDTLSPDERRHYLWVIDREGHKLSRIVDELLTFASVRNQDDVPRNPLHMGLIITSAMGRLSYIITETKAQITANTDDWPLARGYAPWVEEVWTNYLSNAIKYGGTPPVIVFGADDARDGMVRFWVRDNGRGITPEHQAQLFEQFQRLDEVHATGHGLGLSIVKRIVAKLGGIVGVESAPSAGSTFYFTLPEA
ncbi:MAG: PAS domain-containing sensor histidine kinase [Anaerolineae bacterium]|nr:PAS domain-containing sensor histidine kinase [Anaerolineae bacterium]